LRIQDLARYQSGLGAKERCKNSSFAPSGLCLLCSWTHGLRRGPYSFAASRLGVGQLLAPLQGWSMSASSAYASLRSAGRTNASAPTLLRQSFRAGVREVLPASPLISQLAARLRGWSRSLPASLRGPRKSAFRSSWQIPRAQADSGSAVLVRYPRAGSRLLFDLNQVAGGSGCGKRVGWFLRGAPGIED
jgi:hypothetical protein